MHSESFKAMSLAEMEEKIHRLRENGFDPNLAIVFSNICFDIRKVKLVFQKENIQCVGATSAGEFVNGELEQPGITCMLLKLNEPYFKIAFSEIHDNLREAATEIALSGKKFFSSPAFIILISGLNNDGEIILKQIQKTIGEDTPIFGGFASEQLKLDDTFVFANEQITNNGIAVLMMDGKTISVEGLCAGGWRPIGIVRTITKSSGNKVLTIDGEPALDLIVRYMKMSVSEFDKGPEVIAGLSRKFQLQLKRNDSYAVMRAPISVNVQERSVTYTGEMPEGAQIQFSLLPSFEVIDNVVRDFEDLNKYHENPDAILIFSCKAREMIFGPLIADEVLRIYEIWNAPLSGFLSYGEIGKVHEVSEYHGMMCSLVLLKEKQSEISASE